MDEELEAVICIMYVSDGADGWIPALNSTGGGGTGGLTDTELRATPVEVTVVGGSPSGGLTDTELRATPVVVDLNDIDGVSTEATLADTLVTLGDILIKLDDLLEPGGSVDVGNFPAVYPVTDNGGSLTVDGTFWQATQPVSGTFWQATQPVSGPLTDTQLRAVPVPVSGTVVATLSEPISIDDNGGSLTVDGTFWQATQPVSGPLTDVQLRATPVDITGTVAATLSEPISVDDNGGSLTIDNAQLSVIGGGTEVAALRVTLANNSTGLVSVDDNGGSLTVDGTFWQATQPVSGTFWQATQPVSGTFWQATQPVSNTVLSVVGPGAEATAQRVTLSTETLAALETTELGATTLAALENITVTVGAALPAGTNNIGDVDIVTMPAVALDAATLAALESITVTGTFWQATQPVSGTFWQATQPVSGPLTDAQLRATPVPVSGTVTATAGEAKAEDAVAASGDSGIPILAVRNDAAASKTSLDGDYSMLATDAAGRLGIADLGGSITVDGTFWQATQPVSLASVPTHGVTGTFWQATQPVSIAAAVAVTDNAGSLTVDAPVGTPVFVRLSDGAATLIGQKAMSASLPVVLASDQASVPVANTEVRPATATLANVSGSASSVTLQTSNAARRWWACHNDSTAILYVKFGSTASATSYTVKLQPDAYYEMIAPAYTGIITGIWASATGSARMTEMI